jgi:hypothetical protein
MVCLSVFQILDNEEALAHYGLLLHGKIYIILQMPSKNINSKFRPRLANSLEIGQVCFPVPCPLIIHEILCIL